MCVPLFDIPINHTHFVFLWIKVACAHPWYEHRVLFIRHPRLPNSIILIAFTSHTIHWGFHAFPIIMFISAVKAQTYDTHITISVTFDHNIWNPRVFRAHEPRSPLAFSCGRIVWCFLEIPSISVAELQLPPVDALRIFHVFSPLLVMQSHTTNQVVCCIVPLPWFEIYALNF